MKLIQKSDNEISKKESVQNIMKDFMVKTPTSEKIDEKATILNMH